MESGHPALILVNERIKRREPRQSLGVLADAVITSTSPHPSRRGASAVGLNAQFRENHARKDFEKGSKVWTSFLSIFFRTYEIIFARVIFERSNLKQAIKMHLWRVALKAKAERLYPSSMRCGRCAALSLVGDGATLDVIGARQ